MGDSNTDSHFYFITTLMNRSKDSIPSNFGQE